ncbi:MAG: FIST C-terminal domain-containing protein [Phycisphaerae bacterium]|nr:FIST C-terminal domain-containing protein [Phycisphaerae bacterium]
MKKYIVVLLILSAAAAVGVWMLVHSAEDTSITAVDDDGTASLTEAQTISPIHRHAAVGWSVADDPRQGVREALAMARDRLGEEKAVFAIVVPTQGYSTQAVVEELDSLLEPGAKVYGITSGWAVMTPDGYHQGKVGAIGILLVGEKAGIRFGVGEVDGITPADLKAQGAEAIRRGIADAGMPPQSRPEMVLYCGYSYFGGEMKILDGIAEVVGVDTPVVGGNARDSAFAGGWSQFTRKDIYTKGLVLATLFTEKNIGWAFESGFRLTESSGVVTKANAEGTLLYEIDGRGALDVYDEWLGGKLLPVLRTKTSEELVAYTALNPLGCLFKGAKGQTGYIVAHPIPTKENLEDRAVPVYSQILQGSKIHLFAGQWQNLLNRAEQAAANALERGTLKPSTTTFGVLYFCRGAKSVIPSTQTPTIPLLVRNQIPDVPFIGVFTGGEQGPLPGIRNVNCNLVVSMVLVGR